MNVSKFLVKNTVNILKLFKYYNMKRIQKFREKYHNLDKTIIMYV